MSVLLRAIHNIAIRQNSHRTRLDFPHIVLQSTGAKNTNSFPRIPFSYPYSPVALVCPLLRITGTA